MNFVVMTKTLQECRSRGDFMRYARESRKISVAELSRMSGVYEGTILNWEHNRRSPVLDVCVLVCNALNCSIDEYIGRKTG